MSRDYPWGSKFPSQRRQEVKAKLRVLENKKERLAEKVAGFTASADMLREALNKKIESAKSDLLEVERFLAAKELASVSIKDLSPRMAEAFARLTAGGFSMDDIAAKIEKIESDVVAGSQNGESKDA
jgi:hypothetical protein